MRYLILLAFVCSAAMADWNKVEFGGKTLLLNPKAQALPTTLLGPFAKRGDGGIVAADDSRVMISKDGGKTWEQIGRAHV